MIVMVETLHILILIQEIEWHISSPCVCGHNSWLIFLLVQKIVKGCAALYQNLNHPHDSSCTPSFSSCSVLTVRNERIMRVSSHRLIPWMSWTELGLYQIQMVICPFRKRDNEDRPFIVFYVCVCVCIYMCVCVCVCVHIYIYTIFEMGRGMCKELMSTDLNTSSRHKE